MLRLRVRVNDDYGEYETNITIKKGTGWKMGIGMYCKLSKEMRDI
jgi:hypothetical protein